jgi:hypothetical protein
MICGKEEQTMRQPERAAMREIIFLQDQSYPIVPQKRYKDVISLPSDENKKPYSKHIVIRKIEKINQFVIR